MAQWVVLDRSQDTDKFERTLTDIMKVPGGSLYRTRVWGFGAHGKGLPPSVAMVFVPEPAPTPNQDA